MFTIQIPTTKKEVKTVAVGVATVTKVNGIKVVNYTKKISGDFYEGSVARAKLAKESGKKGLSGLLLTIAAKAMDKAMDLSK